MNNTSFFATEAAANAAFGDHLPFPDDLRRRIIINVSPFDTTVPKTVANAPLMKHLTLRHPCETDEKRAHGIAYGEMADILEQPFRFPNLKTVTLTANDVGGPMRQNQYCPQQLLFGLRDRALDELTLARTNLPPFATPFLLRNTRAKKLVFRETVFYGFQRPENFDLSENVKSVAFYKVVDLTFINWIFSGVKDGRKIELTVEFTAPKVSVDKWRTIHNLLPKVESLTLVNPKFDDRKCKIWNHMQQSQVVGLHLIRPQFAPNLYPAFLTYVHTSQQLQCIRLTGRIDNIDLVQGLYATEQQRHNFTRQFLHAVGESNIPIVMFPTTTCTVGHCIADALEHLKCEVLDVGIEEPKEGEENPGIHLITELKKNRTLGAFKDDNRMKAAYRKGVYGINVRAIQDGLDPNTIYNNDTGRTWELWSNEHVDKAYAVCRRNYKKHIEEINTISEEDDNTSNEDDGNDDASNQEENNEDDGNNNNKDNGNDDASNQEDNNVDDDDSNDEDNNVDDDDSNDEDYKEENEDNNGDD